MATALMSNKLDRLTVFFYSGPDPLILVKELIGIDVDVVTHLEVNVSIDLYNDFPSPQSRMCGCLSGEAGKVLVFTRTAL